MASPFKQLLIALQEKILADIPYDENTRAGVKEVNHDFGQIDIEGMRPAVAMPWIGIDFSDAQYDQKQFKVQWAKINITFRLCFDPWSNSSSLAPEDVRAKALAYYEIEDKLYTSLQDWRYEYQAGQFLLMKGLRRLSAVTEQRKDTLRVRRVVFECWFEDRAVQALVP